MKVEKINPAEVDLEDRSFFFPYFGGKESLRESIRRVGVLSDPVALRTPGGGLIPALGRRRLEAARDVGLETVRCMVADANVPHALVYEWAFWDNLPIRNWEPALRCFVVARLLEFFDPIETADRFLPWLHVQASGPGLERMKAVGSLDLRSLGALASGRIPERTAVILARLEEAERRTILSIIDSLQLNVNRAAEFVERVYDLSVLNGNTVGHWLAREEIRSLVKDAVQPVRQRAQDLRELLEAWKFPERVRRRSDFNAWLNNVSAPTRATVRPAQEDEDESCVITIRARDREEAAMILAALPNL
jgi:ParB-like chromosome segregation protein Spo0J